MKKSDWESRRAAWTREMLRAAGYCDPTLKKLFGPIAWGRFEGESKASGDDLANVVFGCGYLAGARAVLLAIARRDQLQGMLELEEVATKARP